MARLRRCDSRCHNAKGKRCACWCLGAFHGIKGFHDRDELANGGLKLSDALSYKPGEVVYIDQPKLPLGVKD